MSAAGNFRTGEAARQRWATRREELIIRIRQAVARRPIVERPLRSPRLRPHRSKRRKRDSLRLRRSVANKKQTRPEPYTYLWLDEDGRPYYVGKGIGQRAYRKGSPPPERIIIQHWTSHDEAFEAERILIAYYGRMGDGTGTLQNRSTGGGGGVPSRRRNSVDWSLLQLYKNTGFYGHYKGADLP